MSEVPPSRKSKPSNARRATPTQRRHQHFLDVKVRADEAGRQRKRWLFSVLSKALLGLSLLVGGYFGVSKAVAMLLLKNPEYNVADLNVETDGVLQPDAVLQAADLHKGENIFLLNLGRAKARVEAIPEVEKVQITRQLPNRISIQINERKPVAWIASDYGPANRDHMAGAKSVYFIDAQGMLLQPKKITAQDAYLPLIRNYSGGPLADGQEASGEEVRAALDLLHAHQDSLIAGRFQIQEIDLSKHFGLEVTDHNGLQVLFDLYDMDKQLKRLDVYLQAIDQHGQKPQTINLLVQRNVPVTFVTDPVPADQAITPATAQTSPVAPSTKNSLGGADKAKSRGKSKTPDPKHHHA